MIIIIIIIIISTIHFTVKAPCDAPYVIFAKNKKFEVCHARILNPDCSEQMVMCVIKPK